MTGLIFHPAASFRISFPPGQINLNIIFNIFSIFQDNVKDTNVTFIGIIPCQLLRFTIGKIVRIPGPIKAPQDAFEGTF